MIGKIILVLGILGVLLGFVVTAISVALPSITNGRTSWEEAMFGIIPGVVVLVISFVIAVVGLVIIIMGRKKSE